MKLVEFLVMGSATIRDLGGAALGLSSFVAAPFVSAVTDALVVLD